MFTCFIRYKIEPNQLDEFRAYAHSWISLVRKYGGTHHGYFIPGTAQDNLPSPDFSFPDLGAEGPRGAQYAHPYRNRRRLSCAVGKQPDLGERRTAAVLVASVAARSCSGLKCPDPA